MNDLKVEAQCANCRVKFYIPKGLLGKKRSCPKCKKILLLKDQSLTIKPPKSMVFYGGIFFLLTIFFLLVWLSMIMQILRVEGPRYIAVPMMIGIVVITVLAFTSLNLIQGKLIARYGLYLFITTNICGGVWQYQKLNILLEILHLSYEEFHHEVTMLVVWQLLFFLLIYVPLLYIFRLQYLNGVKLRN